MSRTIVIEHNGVIYHGKVAKITRTMIGMEDHGIVTAYLYVDGDGWGIGVGGYCLDTPVKINGEHSHREGTGYGLDHIMRLTQTVGAPTWEQCVGREVIVLFDNKNSWGSIALGIAHITDEKKVLILKEHADQWHKDHPEDSDK